MSYMVQGSGLGVLKHNTVVFGWPVNWRTKATGDLLTQRAPHHAGRRPGDHRAAVPLARPDRRRPLDDRHVLDHAAGGGLMLLISCLPKSDKAWSKAKLRIFCVAESDDNSIQMKQDLDLFLKLLRITAEVSVCICGVKPVSRSIC